MAQQESALSKEMEQLRKDFASLRSDLSGVVETLRNMGAEQGRNAYQRARQAGEQAYGQARATGEQAYGQARAAEQAVEREISERPLISVLGAFGVGFLVGVLLDRRH